MDDMNRSRSHKVNALDAMNNSGLWMIRMIIGCEFKALDVIKN